jgi:AcrR family transcriptional regulator
MGAAESKMSRREAKARSRERLVGATIHILRDQGASGLTTGKIARAAGLSQPSFYVHFKDMDDAVEAAAERIGEKIRCSLSDARQALRQERSHAALYAIFTATLEALLADPTCTEVLLKHRRDETTHIGKYSVELLRSMRDDMLEDCRSFGLTDERLPQLELFVDFMNALTLSAVEGFLDGRYKDRAVCVEALVRASVSVYMGLESMSSRPG